VARVKLGFWYRLAVVVLKPPLVVLTKRDWRNRDLLPHGQGIVVAPNHISYLDPLVVAHYLHDNKRPPRFLAKDAMFRVPFVGRLLRGAQQIPVYRKSKEAGNAMRDAISAIERGECVVVYPEGTLTRDPDLWPMSGKTGAARIALSSGCPVIPMAQWGSQEVLAPYAKTPRLLPRKTLTVTVGPPVDLSGLLGKEQSAEVLREATERIMSAITALVAGIRGEEAPTERFDVRTSGLPETGNPNSKPEVKPNSKDRKSA